MLDKSKVTKYMKVSGGIIFKRGEHNELEILLIQRAADDFFPLMWEIPRGKCDQTPNEKIIPCLKREVKEECGIDVIPLKYIDKFSYIADEGTRLSTQYNFLCKLKDPNQEVILSREHDDFKWITSFSQAELSVMPEIKKSIFKVFDIFNGVQIVDYSIDDDFQEDDLIEEYLNLLWRGKLR